MNVSYPRMSCKLAAREWLRRQHHATEHAGLLKVQLVQMAMDKRPHTASTADTSLTEAVLQHAEACRTAAATDWQTQLCQALNNMMHATPPVLFAGRWRLLQEQRMPGGQAVVQVRIACAVPSRL